MQRCNAHLKLTSLVEMYPWIMTFEGDPYPIAPPELQERHACTQKKTAENLARNGL